MIVNTSHIKSKTNLFPQQAIITDQELGSFMAKLNILKAINPKKSLSNDKEIVFISIFQAEADLKERQHIMHSSALRKLKMHFHLLNTHTKEGKYHSRAKLPTILNINPIK
jgi:hypothetical protein